MIKRWEQYKIENKVLDVSLDLTGSNWVEFVQTTGKGTLPPITIQAYGRQLSECDFNRSMQHIG
jgi:hypothetical protein